MKAAYIIVVIAIAGVFFMFGIIFNKQNSDHNTEILQSEIKQLQSERDSIKVIKDSLSEVISLQQAEFDSRIANQEERKKISHEKISHTRTLSPDSAFGYFSGWVSDTSEN